MTDEKKTELYERQMKLLRTFLEHGAITRAQFLKSSGDLKAKLFPAPAAEKK